MSSLIALLIHFKPHIYMLNIVQSINSNIYFYIKLDVTLGNSFMRIVTDFLSRRKDNWKVSKNIQKILLVNKRFNEENQKDFQSRCQLRKILLCSESQYRTLSISCSISYNFSTRSNDTRYFLPISESFIIKRYFERSKFCILRSAGTMRSDRILGNIELNGGYFMSSSIFLLLRLKLTSQKNQRSNSEWTLYITSLEFSSKAMEGFLLAAPLGILTSTKLPKSSVFFVMSAIQAQQQTLQCTASLSRQLNSASCSSINALIVCNITLLFSTSLQISLAFGMHTCWNCVTIYLSRGSNLKGYLNLTMGFEGVGLPISQVSYRYFSQIFCRSELQEITICYFLVGFLEKESYKVVLRMFSMLLTIEKQRWHQLEMSLGVVQTIIRKMNSRKQIGTPLQSVWKLPVLSMMVMFKRFVLFIMKVQWNSSGIIWGSFS